MHRRHLGIVVTAYNAELIVAKLLEAICGVAKKITLDYEVLVIDDHSTDNTWEEIDKCCRDNTSIKAVRMARNFGQHAAIAAGLQMVDADYVVMMDGDFQDDPDDIEVLYRAIYDSPFEVVYGKREDRRDRKSKILASAIFYKAFTSISGIKTDPTIGTFRIMSRKVVDTFREFSERNKYIGGIFYWMGFSSDVVRVNHKTRPSGKSGYNVKRLIKLASLGIISFSNKPLNFAIYIGFVASVLSMMGAVYYTVRKIFFGVNISGYSSIIVSLYLIGGLLLFVLGIIGQYIGQIYEQTKQRPEYIVGEKINFE